jgi:hypothetical protein
LLLQLKTSRRKLEKGGFGPVFYGKLNNRQEVAIKVLDIASQQGSTEFFNEVCLQICSEILYERERERERELM